LSNATHAADVMCPRRAHTRVSRLHRCSRMHGSGASRTKSRKRVGANLARRVRPDRIVVAEVRESSPPSSCSGRAPRRRSKVACMEGSPRTPGTVLEPGSSVRGSDKGGGPVGQPAPFAARDRLLFLAATGRDGSDSESSSHEQGRTPRCQDRRHREGPSDRDDVFEPGVAPPRQPRGDGDVMPIQGASEPLLGPPEIMEVLSDDFCPMPCVRHLNENLVHSLLESLGR
jgi:hypothetical protein